MKLPSFIVLGAVKAGTTSLYHYLGQHPDIQMSAWNWPRYFHVADGPPDFAALAANHGETHRAESEGRYAMMIPERIPRDMEQYAALWPATETPKISGEVSPTYLHDPAVCGRIKARAPQTKLVMVLRNPVDRAHSHFVMDRRKGWEDKTDFRNALASEPDDAASFWWGRRHYIRHGLYADVVKQYQAAFPANQMLIMFYEDLLVDPAAYLRRILEFVGADPTFTIDMSTRHNKGLVKRDTLLSRLLYANFPGRELLKQKLPGATRALVSSKITATTHGVAETMSDDIRQELVARFSADVRQLEPMVGRDLSGWLA